MSNTLNRKEQAIEACEKVINGIEDGNITVSSALLLCKKIARLVNDLDGQEWLKYEYGGYPNENGILPDVWAIGEKHGRKYISKDENGKKEEYMFTELCGELEAIIESNKKAISNYTTQGYSVSGETALLATDRMTLRVSQGTNGLLSNIKKSERRLSILKSQYYDYAAGWLIQLKFGNIAKTIFEEYQERVDNYYSQLPTITLQKLSAIERMMEDDNPERYAQVLTSCRRLWGDTAKKLFSEVLPNYKEKTFKTKKGIEIDISGDHVNNMLSAIIETLQEKASKNTLVGSETIYLIDWMENINSRQSAGVHSDVSREQAMQCIIHTYILLGDILALKSEYDKKE